MNLRLKEIRKSKGLTQKDVAEKLQIAVVTYQLYESGKRQMPLNLAYDFANLFEITIEDFLLDAKSEDQPEIRFDEPEISVDDQLKKMRKRVKELEDLNKNLQEALIRAMDKM